MKKNIIDESVISIGADRAEPRRLFAMFALLVLTACASSPAGEGEFDFVTESAVGDFDESIPAQKPDVINLGGTGLYVTTAQTAKRRGIFTRTDENSEDFQTLQNQIELYGRPYRRLVAKTEGDWSGTSNEGPRLDCSRRSNGLGSFLGALLGYKNRTAAALTVTIAPSRAAVLDESSANDFVTDYPVLIVNRNQNEGRGKSCQYKLLPAELTPYIMPAAGDSLYLKFNVLYTTNKSVDFSATLGLVSTIGAMATPSAGFTRNVTNIADVQIDLAINNFLGNWDRSINLTNIRPMKLNADDEDPIDKIVISLGAPTDASSFEDLTFADGPAFSFELEYVPTLFASCRGYLSLAKCENDFDTDDKILGKVYASTPQRDLRQITDEAPAFGAASLANRMVLTRSMDNSDARQAIGEVCQDLKSSIAFEPSSAMNAIDQLIFRYVWLTTLNSEFRNNRRIHSGSCFTPEEVEDLRSLSVNRLRDRFPFPEYELDVDASMEANVRAIGGLLFRGLAGKRQLFGDSGELLLYQRALTETANGAPIRPGSTAGAAAAEALAPVKFVDGPACRQLSNDPRTGRETDRRFGFLHIVRDEAPGGLSDPATHDDIKAGEFYAPFVVELAGGATRDDMSVKKMTVPASIDQYLDLLDSSVTGAQFWEQVCFSRLTSTDQQRALGNMRAIYGGE